MIAFLGKLLKKKEEAASSQPMPVFKPPPNPMPPAEVESVNASIDLSRTDIMERTWGEGFSKPGSARFIVSITGPMQLDLSKTMLDLQAGMGGSSMAVSEAYKTWVTGFERDAEVWEAWKKKDDDAPEKSKYYDIKHFDPATFDYEKRVDGILARELLYTMADKGHMLKKMSGWLKGRGQLVITDFAAEKTVTEGAAVAQWAKGEKDGVNLISPDEMAALLLTHGFDLRVSEDITENYQREVRQGLGKLTRSLEGKSLSMPTKTRVADFAEFWVRREAALGSGVKFLRYYAIKKG
jgi:ubiquinone/menaquinone biosynthesis C-methylase UbiE